MQTGTSLLSISGGFGSKTGPQAGDRIYTDY
jgi:hypothetical protein